MSTLYLDRRDMELKIRDGALAIYRNGRQQKTLPLKMITRIVTRADTLLSSSLLAELATRGIGFTAISGRRGEKIAHLLGDPHGDASRRLAQYHAYNDDDHRLELARKTVSAKVNNQLRFVHRLKSARPDQRASLTKSERAISGIIDRLEEADNLERLRGHEGAAASAGFDALQAVLPPRLQFNGRNRRPPRDPVNAALSLSYTLAHSDAVLASHLAGLDPAIGMLHDPAWGRPSLAADMIEPLRPHIDEWVWTLFRDRVIDNDHFGQEGEACLLKKNGRQRFYGAWEERAPAMRRWLRQSAHALVSELQNRQSEQDET